MSRAQERHDPALGLGSRVAAVAAPHLGKNTNARIKYTAAGEKFDRLVDEALAAPSTLSAQKAVEAMKVLIEEQAAAIPLTSFPQIFALKSTVAGFRAHPSVNQQTWTAVFRTR